jgi:hypothetical protein
MKAVFLILYMLWVSALSVASSKPTGDTARRAVVSGRITLLTSGLAPVPAVSYNNPVVDVYSSRTKGRLILESDFAAALNGQPLAGNGWLRYTITKSARWELRSGLGGTMFFTIEKNGKSENTLQVHRMGTIELTTTTKLSDRISMMLTYQQTKAFDKGAFNGSFIDLAMPVQMTKRTKSLSLVLQPRVCYFNFRGNMNGMYASTMVNVEKKKMPLAFTATLISPMVTGSTGCGWKWSAGITWSF